MKFSNTGGGSGPSTGGGSGMFVSLKDGDSVTGILRGEFKEYFKHWTGAGSTLCRNVVIKDHKTVETGAKCQYCEDGLKPAFKFRCNLVTKENGVMVAKIFEQGRVVYEQFRGLSDDCDLQTTTIKVKRTGAGKSDTRYTVNTPPNASLSEDAIKNLKKIKLRSLDLKEEMDDEGPLAETKVEEDNEDVPF
jgi:hypothetical protein